MLHIYQDKKKPKHREDNKNTKCNKKKTKQTPIDRKKQLYIYGVLKKQQQLNNLYEMCRKNVTEKTPQNKIKQVTV